MEKPGTHGAFGHAAAFSVARTTEARTVSCGRSIP